MEIIIPDPRVTPTMMDAIHDVASDPSSKYHMNSTIKIPNVYVNPSAVKRKYYFSDSFNISSLFLYHRLFIPIM